MTVWLKTKYLSTAPLTNVGTVTGVFATYNVASNYLSLPAAGDQVFAFQGGGNALSSGTITNPTLIAGMNSKASWDASLDACTFTSSSSTLPAALANASIFIPSGNGADLNNRKNARFNCNGNTTASAGVLRASMTNSQNWIFNQQDASGIYNFSSFGCSFT